MTFSQSLQADAVKAKEQGNLSAYEKGFVEDIANYDKKQLGRLTSKQYDLLKKCATKAD